MLPNTDHLLSPYTAQQQLKHHILNLLSLFIILLNSPATAQVDYSLDSLRVVNAEWRIDSLEGFILKRYQFHEGSLFCSAQYLSIIEIPSRSHRRLALMATGEPSTVSSLATTIDAYAAINGSFFNMKLGHPVCYLRIDGEELGENTASLSDSLNRKYYQYACLRLHDGRAELIEPDSSRTWEHNLPDSNIMTAGPMLIRNGKPIKQRSDRHFVTNRYSRTALGIRPDGSTLLVVVDGNLKHHAEGMSLIELARIMQWLGCVDAINLDGGGSSTMYVHDMPHGGVVNHPSNNARYDHLGERRVANAIVLL